MLVLSPTTGNPSPAEDEKDIHIVLKTLLCGTTKQIYVLNFIEYSAHNHSLIHRAHIYIYRTFVIAMKKF